jgi:hypothetical protein
MEPIGCRPFRLSVPHYPHPASVSTSRSSNRTCRFTASGSRRRLTQSPWPLPVTLSATPENNSGVIRLSPISLSVVASCVRLQLRPLPSTGVTRLRQYYKPLRHPKRPGLSLTSCQLIHTAITAGTSVLRMVPCADMPLPIPRQD